MRTLVDIPSDDVKALDAAAERAQKPRAALIREAISDYLARHAVDASEEAFGLWDGKVDGLAYQRKMRSEW
jgi:predicted transcriptional regulator